MGKKRRYIHKVAKFGRKAFSFLDKLDGTQDSQLLSSKLDTAISKIKIADLGNETFSLQFEAMGPGTATQAGGLEKDRVKYSIDDVAVHSSGIHTFAAASSVKGDRSNYKTTLVSPARSGAGGSDVVLAGGTHTISAEIIAEGVAAATATITVTAAAAHADLSGDQLTLNDGTGNVVFTINNTQAPALDGTTIGLNSAANEDAIADAIIAGINAHAIGITAEDASPGGTADTAAHAILLTQDTARAAGNTDITSTLTAVTAPAKFTGGFDAVDTSKSKVKVQKFSLAPAHVDLSSITAAEGAAASDGKIVVKCSGAASIDVAAAKGSLAGETSFTLGSGGTKHAVSLRVKDSSGAYVPLDADVNNILTTQTNGQLNGTGTVLQKGDGAGGSTTFPAGTYTIEASPCKKDGTVISADKQVVASVTVS